MCWILHSCKSCYTANAHTHTPLQTHTRTRRWAKKKTHHRWPRFSRKLAPCYPTRVPARTHKDKNAHTEPETHIHAQERTHTHTHSYTRTQLANRNIDFLPLFLETRFKGVEGGTVFFLLSFICCRFPLTTTLFPTFFSERAFCFTSSTAHCSEFSPAERKRVNNSGETERNRENCRNTEEKTSIFVS